MPPRSTRPLAGIDYDVWYVEALRTFVKERGGSCSDKTKRYLLTRKLKDLDRDWTFRFLDMPPELREMVYGYLLRMDDQTGCVSTPGLLRASKEIHWEAERFLYSTNTFRIRVWSRLLVAHGRYRYVPPEPITGTDFQGIPLRTGQRQPPLQLISTRYSSLPRATFSKIRHLRLEISVINPRPIPSQFEEVNHRLFALASVFGTSTALKTVRFCIHPAMNPHPPRSWRFDKALYPLAKFQDSDVEGAPRREIEFHNFPWNTERVIEDHMAAGTPRPVDSFGPFGHLYQQVAEIKKQVNGTAPIDDHFDVFIDAFDHFIAQRHLNPLVDYEADKLFSRKVRSFQSFYETHEARWRKRICDNAWEAMHGARGGVDFDSLEDADKWFGIQMMRFGRSMRKQRDAWHHMPGNFSV